MNLQSLQSCVSTDLFTHLNFYHNDQYSETEYLEEPDLHRKPSHAEEIYQRTGIPSDQAQNSL